jgi:hypothetical protein
LPEQIIKLIIRDWMIHQNSPGIGQKNIAKNKNIEQIIKETTHPIAFIY